MSTTAAGLPGSAMNRAAAVRDETALEIRFGPLDLAQIRLRTTDPGAIVDELTGRVATAPRFFERVAVCLDLSMLRTDPQAAELRAVVDAVRRAGMLPVGLVQGPACIEALARALDMPVMQQFRAPQKPPPVVQPPGAPAPATQPATPLPVPGAAVVQGELSSQRAAPLAQRAHAAAQRESAPAPEFLDQLQPALIHDQPVRSGQRIYARHRDLIITASVGAGAEVMADGCVHVYGALRGRALAGARGATAARVFCQEFYAELISVAGVFRVFESVPAELAAKPVQAWLSGDDLRLART